MPLRQACDPIGPASSGVLFEVPGVKTDLLEEDIDLGVRGEVVPVDAPRIPVDQDIADIEDDGGHSAASSPLFIAATASARSFRISSSSDWKST